MFLLVYHAHPPQIDSLHPALMVEVRLDASSSLLRMTHIARFILNLGQIGAFLHNQSVGCLELITRHGPSGQGAVFKEVEINHCKPCSYLPAPASRPQSYCTGHLYLPLNPAAITNGPQPHPLTPSPRQDMTCAPRTPPRPSCRPATHPC